VSVSAVCGDVSLHNREALTRGLAGAWADATTDLALVAGAYERWGDACAGRLLGDFSFAVQDERDGGVFAARDPMGVKPLYYRVTRGAIALATTAAGVAGVDGLPLELEPRRIADALVPALESADQTGTFYRDVHRLPPAHLLSFQHGRLKLDRYWGPDTATELRLPSDDAYEEAFRAVFAKAVDCRLGDDVASMLSGGLDSSAIVGFARSAEERRGRPLTTLSGVTEDPGCEESQSVRSVLSLPGLDPVSITPDQLDSFDSEIDRFLVSMEEPFDASMILPLILYAVAARRGFRAVLDGVDGDSVASLEPSYLDTLLAGGAWRSAVREAAGLARFYGGSYGPWASTYRLLLGSTGRAWAPSLVRTASRRVRRPGRIADALSGTIVSGDAARQFELAGRLEDLWGRRASGRATIRERHAAELCHPNVSVALERYHRVAASQGIDARHPFMDRRVVEFCLALPWNQKVRNGWSKFIVRRACAGLVPDDVRWRRGRFVRLGPRFLAAAIVRCRAILEREAEDDFSELAPYVDRPKLRRAVAAFRRGRSPEAAETIWRSASLNCWIRHSRRNMYHAASRANGQAAPPRVPRVGPREIQPQES